MHKIAKKALSIGVSALMSISMVSQALAAGSNYAASVNGASVKVEKYLVMDKEAKTPAVTFNFDIAAGTPIAATTGKLAIKAGNDRAVSGTPTVSTAVFTAGQDTYTTAQDLPNTGTKQATQSKDPVTLTSDQAYARSEITVNLANVSFSEPGVYRWVITEQANETNANRGITNDPNATRVLDAYVIDNNGSLEVQGYVLHNNTTFQPATGATADEPADGKAKGYINEYETEDLTVSKTVAGNQGSRDEYFRFDISITNAGDGTIIPIDLTNADGTTLTNAASPEAHTNPTSITCDSSGAGTTTIWMQHNQSVVLQGLPKNAGYTITETNGDYSVTTAQREGSGTATNGTEAAVSDTAITADSTVAYTNTRSGVIPTGVIMHIAPFLAIAGVGLIGLVYIMSKGKKSREE